MRSAIYSVTPCGDNEDEFRLVEVFDTREYALTVLEALECVNINFNYYVIRPLEKDYIFVEKR